MIVLLILFLVASLIFLIVVMAKRLNSPKVIPTVQSNTKAKQTIRVDLKDFEINNLRGKLFQLLESLATISNSINVDIVIGTYDFLNKITPDLTRHKVLDVYSRYFHDAVEEYKSMYYDRLITEEQAYFCNNPDDNNKLVEFYGVNLMRAYFMSVQNHMDAITGMKQKKAMIGRYDKIIELSEMVKESIKSLSGLEKRNEYLQYIFEVRQDVSIKKDIL